MSDRRKVWDLLYVPVMLLLAAGVLAVAWLSVRPLALPLLNRWVSESDPDVRPPPEAFDRFRRQQDEIAHGDDRGPIRCTLVPSPDSGGGNQADFLLGLTNTSDRPVTIWYYTWPHAHVTFLVRDGEGKGIGQFRWGSLSSQLVTVDPATGKPTGPVPTRTLQPGETYTAGIFLSTLSDYLDVPPGRYRVEAVFLYGDLGGWPDGEQLLRRAHDEVEAGQHRRGHLPRHPEHDLNGALLLDPVTPPAPGPAEQADYAQPERQQRRGLRDGNRGIDVGPEGEIEVRARGGPASPVRAGVGLAEERLTARIHRGAVLPEVTAPGIRSQHDREHLPRGHRQPEGADVDAGVGHGERVGRDRSVRHDHGSEDGRVIRHGHTAVRRPDVEQQVPRGGCVFPDQDVDARQGPGNPHGDRLRLVEGRGDADDYGFPRVGGRVELVEDQVRPRSSPVAAQQQRDGDHGRPPNHRPLTARFKRHRSTPSVRRTPRRRTIMVSAPGLPSGRPSPGDSTCPAARPHAQSGHGRPRAAAVRPVPATPPPRRRPGDLPLRDCAVVIPSITDAPIPWPWCRALGGGRGGSGPWLGGDLEEAVRREPAAAVRFWWRLSASTVWKMRKALGVTRTNNAGTPRSAAPRP